MLPGRLEALPADIERRETGAHRSGARSGALLAAGSGAGILANYVFLLAAGRILGSEDYGSLAALLGLLAIVVVPAGALQMAVSREISRRLARGDSIGADAFARAAFRLALVATVPLVAVGLALSVPLARLLNIESAGVVVLAEIMLATALVFPIAMGVLQGRQRFFALAMLYILPYALRLALLAAAAAGGYRLGGAILATVVGGIVGTVLAVALILEPLRRGGSEPRPELGAFLRYLGPVAVGLVGIALLTHIDILVVKARLAGDLPGAYGAASAFARVAFFVPATILAVLFPRTAARQARGEATEDILGRSLLATFAFCAALALVYAAAGVGLVATTFGADFAEGGEVLAPFALAIGLYSVAHILVGYHLSRGETRYAWIVAAGVVLQLIALALVPASLENIVWVNVAVAASLLAAHELLIGSSVPAIRAGVRALGGVAARLRTAVPEAAVVLVGATVFTCVFFWRVVAHLGSTVIGSPGSDSTGTVAWFWQIRHEGYHVLGTTHHTLSGAPLGWDEGNGLNIQWLLPYYPGYLAAKLVGEVAALNLVVLSGYMLSAASMYLLVRYLGCVPLVAAWAALAFIVFPWHVARAEHASLLHLEVLVLLVLALVAAARRPSWQRFALVAAATLGCWLTSGYFGAMAVVTTAAFAVGAALTLDRRRGALLVLGSTTSAFAATAAVAVASFVSGVGRGAGLERAPEDLSALGLRPLELVVPPASNIVFGDWFESFWAGRVHGSNLTETTNYLGLLTITLALGWLVLALRRRGTLDPGRLSATAGLVATFVVGFAFAAPSPLVLFGREIWMPSRLLWEVVPAFRVPSRWDPLLMTALVPLAALGLQAFWRRLAPRGGGIRTLAVAAVGAAMAISFVELATSPAQPRFRTNVIPAEYAAVERTPRGVLAEYPLGYSDLYRLWQRHHGRPLVNGAPSDTPADHVRLMVLDPAAPGTARTLALLGVTAVVIHPDAVVDSEVAPRVPAAGDGYELVARVRDGDSVWRVVARPARALVTLPPGAFAKPRRRDDGAVWYPLISPGGVGSIEIRAKEPGIVRLVFEVEPPRGASRTLRLADAAAERALTFGGRGRMSAVVHVPRGHSRLLVKTDPPATSEADAILISTPRIEAASGDPVLRAELLSLDPGF